MPYRDFRVEYPPGALPAFILPSLVASGESPVYEPELNGAARSLRARVRHADDPAPGGDGGATAVALAALGVTVGHAAVALGLVGATPVLLGELALTRFDALPVALTAQASRRSSTGGPPRRVALGARDLGEALSAPPVPLIALYVGAPRSDGRLARGRARCGDRRRDPPVRGIAPSEAWFSIHAQLSRGVQVESLPGNVVIALGSAADQSASGSLGVGVAEGGTGEVRSADVTGTLGQVAGTLGGLAAVAVVSPCGSRRGGVVRWTTTPLRDGTRRRRRRQLALGRVLSPQFVLWLVPLVPLVAARRGRIATALLASRSS